MSWEKAKKSEACDGCDDEIEIDQDIFCHDGNIYCEACYDDMELYQCQDDDVDYDRDYMQGWDDEEGYKSMFADPGGRSALRAATPDNPRDRPCPQCNRQNVLTPADVRLSYVCDHCADQAEGCY